MDNSFTLLSTMSPKIENKHKTTVHHQKVPTKLALKKNIRRSSIFDGVQTVTQNISLILVEDSTTDSSYSNSSNSKLTVVNSTAIIISDSDSSKSENYGVLERATGINNELYKIQNDYGLSESKFNAIDKWISNVKDETTKLNSVTSKKEDEKIDVLNNCDNYTNKNLEKEENVEKKFSNNYEDNVKNNKSENDNSSNIAISAIKSNNSVASSSDIIEDSDDNLNSQNVFNPSLLDKLYGKNWRKTKDILLPQSERRYKKKKTNIPKIVPKTEVKTKGRWSIVHKNPYLDSVQKSKNTPSTHSKASSAMSLTKRLQALCDSDSSDKSFEEESQKNQNPIKVELFFSDKAITKKDSFNNKVSPLNIKDKHLKRNVQSFDTSTDSEKENFSDFSINSESLENRVRKKLTFNEKTKSLGLEKKDFCNDKKETLEDELQRKLVLNDKTKIPVPKKNNTKKVEDLLKSILNDKTNLATTETDLHKETNINIKKKKVSKTKEVKKKLPVSSKNNDGKTNETNEDCKKSFLASLSGYVPISQCDPSARIFRNNFKIYKNELVTKLFKLYNEKIFSNAIDNDSPIEWSERMRGTAGYCYCKKITRSTGLIERKVRIVLASKVLDSADRVRDTLIHEMCHAATWVVNKVSDGHGSYWKAWAHKARQTFPELPPIQVCHNYAINTKYTYKCTDCGYSFGRHSKSLNTERKRCGYCYGTFEILINKKTKGGETKTVPVTPKKQATGFALFVKENYAIYKTPQLSHAQTMKLLGQKFSELKVTLCEEDKDTV